MMSIKVDPPALEAIAAVFGAASSDADTLRGMLAAGADAPDSTAVIGGATAAGEYQHAFQQWLRNLSQIASSLDTMARKVAVAATYYAQTEAGNTV